MTTEDRTVYLPSGAIMLVGLWLILSAWVLDTGISQPSRLNAIVVGILITLLAAGNIWGQVRSTVLSWLIAALGAWTIAAPFFFAEPRSVPWTWSSVISGIVVCALGIVDATTWPAAEAEPQWRRAALAPWIAGRDFPGLAFEWEDYPLWMLAHGRRRGGAQGEFRGVGPRGWQRSDEQILADVCGLMADDPRLDASDIDVTVTNGEVTLQGDVASRPARRLAEAIADSVRGVRDVFNRLRVRDKPDQVRRAA